MSRRKNPEPKRYIVRSYYLEWFRWCVYSHGVPEMRTTTDLDEAIGVFRLYDRREPSTIPVWCTEDERWTTVGEHRREVWL